MARVVPHYARTAPLAERSLGHQQGPAGYTGPGKAGEPWWAGSQTLSRYAQVTSLAKFVSFHPELTAKSRTARQGAAEGTWREGYRRNIHQQSGLGGSAQVVPGRAVGSASWGSRDVVTGVEGCKQEGSMQWAAGRAST